MTHRAVIAKGVSPKAQKPVSASAQHNAQFTLMPHQVEAVKVVGKASLGCRLIGDEMRVGKTPTGIAIDLSLREEVVRKQRGNNCTLIVCPKSAIDVWVYHLAALGVSSSRVVVVDLPKKEALKASLKKIENAKRKANAPVRYVVINWDTVQLLERELKRAGPWFHIIGDEIHRIKGRDTKRTNSFKRVKAKQLTGLSGTPADNKPEDFWSVLNWLKPRDFSSYWSFVDEYCEVEETKTGFKKITGVKEKSLPHLRARIAPYYIRRRLADVVDSLPQKQYRTITVEMGARQRREYDKFVAKDIVEVQGGDILADYDVAKLVRQQQMAIGCCAVESNGDVHISDSPASPKLDAVMDLIKEEPELGPFIFFAQHHDTVRLLKDRLGKAGETVSSIIGTTSQAERASQVANYQSGRSSFFVGAIGSCREAITLNRANTIVFIDRAWNSNWNRQAEARADGLGKTTPVTIITIETLNSIDQHRLLRINAKARDTDAMVRTGNSCQSSRNEEVRTTIPSATPKLVTRKSIP